MKRDPVVEEVRKARDAYAKRFDYDLDAICRDLQAKQRLSDKKVFSLPPKRPRKMVMCERAKPAPGCPVHLTKVNIPCKF